jgi:hypothetical protein
MLHGGRKMPKRVGVMANEIFDGDDRDAVMWVILFLLPLWEKVARSAG